MKPLNTIPLENFLEKAKIAIKSNQKTLVLNIKEVESIYDSISIVMTRLAGEFDGKLQSAQNPQESIKLNMDGGGFGKF